MRKIVPLNFICVLEITSSYVSQRLLEVLWLFNIDGSCNPVEKQYNIAEQYFYCCKGTKLTL